jgi:hypothetical protein
MAGKDDDGVPRERVGNRPDFSKPLPTTKLPSTIQSILDSDEKMWEVLDDKQYDANPTVQPDKYYLISNMFIELNLQTRLPDTPPMLLDSAQSCVQRTDMSHIPLMWANLSVQLPTLEWFVRPMVYPGCISLAMSVTRVTKPITGTKLYDTRI